MREVRLTELLGPFNEAERKQAPETVFADGDVELLLRSPKIAVVGTRRPSELGARRTERLASELAEAGAVVVSGLAQGVDAIAHRTAIQAGGRTIAVLGAGLDVPFPRANAGLLEEIRRDHLALSQFPPGTPPRKGNFPRRNRTMAFASDATVIVEAGEGSGTIHQGWEALRLGRPLFLLRSLSEEGLDWVEEMLRYGAQPLDDVSPLLEVLPAVAPVLDGEGLPF